MASLLNFDQVKLDDIPDTEQPDGQTDFSRLPATMDTAFKQDPDQFVQNTDTSNLTGLPVDVVERDPAYADRQKKMGGIDFTELTLRSPVTSNYLTEYSNAVIAQDDVDTLVKIEDWFSTVFTGTLRSGGLAFKEQGTGALLAATDYVSPVEGQESPILTPGILPGIRVPDYVSDAYRFGISEVQRRLMGFDDRESFEGFNENLKTELIADLNEIAAQREGLTPEDMTTIQAGTRAGLESLDRKSVV